MTPCFQSAGNFPDSHTLLNRLKTIYSEFSDRCFTISLQISSLPGEVCLTPANAFFNSYRVNSESNVHPDGPFLLPPAALERGYYTQTFIHCIIFPVPALLFMMFIANFLPIHIRV